MLEPGAAEVDDNDRPRSAEERARAALRGLRQADPARLVAHLSVVAAFVVSAVHSMASGWRAVSDDGVISLRAWDVFSSHSPLVGQHTQVASVFAQSVNDLGPLQYWLLAIPTRIDPVHGALWASALWCVAAAAVAVEAGYAAAGRLGAAVAAATVVWAAAWMPDVAVNSVWNPYFGLVFFIAAIASSYAVLCGKHRWWPVAVVAGSVAAQCHLMFVLAAAALVLGSGVVLAVRTVRERLGPRPVAAGLIAGACCWIAPIIQQFTSHPGNLTLLLRSQSPAARMGPAFGLRSLATAVGPVALWMHEEQRLLVVQYLKSGSAALGVVFLLATAAALVLALRWRQYNLAYLAAISLVASLSLVLTYGNVIVAKDIDFSYLAAIALPIGILVWATIAWGVYDNVKRFNGAGRPAAAASEANGDEIDSEQGPAHRPVRSPAATRRARLAVSLALAAALVGLGVGDQVFQWSTVDGIETPALIHWSEQAASQIEAKVPRGSVNLQVLTSGKKQNTLDDYGVTVGIAWQLAHDGWTPLVPKYVTDVLGPGYDRQFHRPTADVYLRPDSVLVKVFETAGQKP